MNTALNPFPLLQPSQHSSALRSAAHHHNTPHHSPSSCTNNLPCFKPAFTVRMSGPTTRQVFFPSLTCELHTLTIKAQTCGHSDTGTRFFPVCRLSPGSTIAPIHSPAVTMLTASLTKPNHTACSKCHRRSVNDYENRCCSKVPDKRTYGHIPCLH